MKCEFLASTNFFVLLRITIFLLASTFVDSQVCDGVPPETIRLVPYPGDCSKYYRCYSNTQSVNNCPPGEWFNEKIQSCDHPEVSGCTTSVCSPNGLENLVAKRFPTDCTKYIKCVESQETVLSCPPMTWFDEGQQMCLLPQLSDCQGGNLTPTVLEEKNDSRCDDGNSDFWPEPDCTKFIRCWEGFLYEFSCPEGLYFNSLEKVCTDPDQSDCEPTETPIISTSTTKGWTPDPLCPWPSNEETLFPYPGDCSKYITCFKGMRKVEECPYLLWFSPVYLVCLEPYQSDCQMYETP